MGTVNLGSLSAVQLSKRLRASGLDGYADAALAAHHRHLALRAALREICSGPDASKGEDYGCLDLHEARTIAQMALDEDER